MKTLDKEQSRKRLSGLRKLWGEFNPIGTADLPRDAYSVYCDESMRMLESGASEAEFNEYLQKSVFETMGLSKSAARDESITAFIPKMRDWFQKHWADTTGE